MPVDFSLSVKFNGSLFLRNILQDERSVHQRTREQFTKLESRLTLEMENESSPCLALALSSSANLKLHRDRTDKVKGGLSLR